MPDSDGLAVHVDPNGETVVENEKEERLLLSVVVPSGFPKPAHKPTIVYYYCFRAIDNISGPCSGLLTGRPADNHALSMSVAHC